MRSTFNKNMATLRETVGGVVRNMNPTMICMCEVGDTEALSQQQMQDVADHCIRAWTGAATEHINLQSMFATGAPYMTIYMEGPIQC